MRKNRPDSNRIFQVYFESAVIEYVRTLRYTRRAPIRIRACSGPNIWLFAQCLGAVLQNDQPITYASRALTDAEKRYAQIEKELLAVVYGLEKFHTYTYGRSVAVQSDHKPLEMIFKKSLHKAPKGLKHMLM